MGSDITDWAEAAGAIYMGANSSWEVTWTIIAGALCVFALIIGARHELDAYTRAQNDK